MVLIQRGTLLSPSEAFDMSRAINSTTLLWDTLVDVEKHNYKKHFPNNVLLE